MKKLFILLTLCLSISVIGNAQNRRPVKKTTTKVVKTPEPPSANGVFKFYYSKEKTGFYNANDGKDYIVITAEGKTISDIKSSVMSTLSSMYANPSKAISTLGDYIINVTGYASDAFKYIRLDNIQRYSFTFNIKIEIKDGKLRIDSPSFSSIIKKTSFMGQIINTDYITANDMYADLMFAKDLNHSNEQVNIENIINSHITKIVNGLSSSDW